LLTLLADILGTYYSPLYTCQLGLWIANIISIWYNVLISNIQYIGSVLWYRGSHLIRFLVLEYFGYSNIYCCTKPLSIPYISFFSRHVFSANQNQKQCTKFTRIKFSLFQSRRENINHDCLNIWICSWRNYIYYIKIFYTIYEFLLYLII
jgi:hypothetical protein